MGAPVLGRKVPSSTAMGPPVSCAPAFIVHRLPRTWRTLPPPDGRTIPCACGPVSPCSDISPSSSALMSSLLCHTSHDTSRALAPDLLVLRHQNECRDFLFYSHNGVSIVGVLLADVEEILACLFQVRGRADFEDQGL